MKNKIFKKIKFLGLTILLLNLSCSDFLSRPPLTSFTDDNFWKSESTVRAFTWGIYDMFYGYGRGGNQYAEFYWQEEGDNSFEMKYTEDLLNSTFLGFPTTPYTSNSMWANYYTNIRKANLMLARIPNVPMSEDAKNHWIGVAKFFRANFYFALVSSWGDVPLITEYAAPEDQDKIYVPRTDRKVVFAQIIADLEDATTLMREDDGLDAVNKYAAYALLARATLFEGTFRKYHSLGEFEPYLTKAAESAGILVASSRYFVKPNSSFKEKYNSDALLGNPEIILYKRYTKNVMMHTLQAYTHSSSPAVHGLTKYAVEGYLCSDGLPIGQSPLYKGDRGLGNVRANRDMRLNDAIFDKLGYLDNPIYNIIISSTGYVTSLYDNPEKDPASTDVANDAKNHIDAPIYTISEAYLIYAEAKAELGTITQEDLDNSVNKLRARANVAKLTLSGSNISASGTIINDSRRTSSLESATMGGIVDPIVWEIRRERRAEL